MNGQSTPGLLKDGSRINRHIIQLLHEKHSQFLDFTNSGLGPLHILRQ